MLSDTDIDAIRLRKIVAYADFDEPTRLDCYRGLLGELRRPLDIPAAPIIGVGLLLLMLSWVLR